MLQTIRERAQGWIAWAIVILISIPFALWGINSYLGVGAEPVVAEINGVEITARDFDNRYHETRMRLRERLGAAYRPELFDEQTMRNQVLDSMIRDAVLVQVAHDLGLRASDRELQQAILATPDFQKDGRFDNATYERVLQLRGMRPPEYEESWRRYTVSTQIERAVLASELATEREIEEVVRLELQQRRVTFVRVPKTDFVDEAAIPEDEVRAYYDANIDRFQTPERVKLVYLVLDGAEITAGETPDETELRRLYDEEKDRFRQGERRAARHILISLAPDADADAQASALARVEDLRGRIEAGEDFADLASEFSEDSGSAKEGGDLGTFERGLMDPAFDQAAFSLAQGELSAPVRSQFGYHLIQVTEIEPETVKLFDEVREQLAGEVARSNAEGMYYDLAERLANLSYENPDSLEPAAESLGLTLQTSQWIDRSGGEGVLRHPKVIAAAFSDDVLREGLNSDLIEPESDVQRAVVLRVLEHEEAAAKPLDDVRDSIVAALRDQRAVAAAKAAADEIVLRLDAGEGLQGAAGGYQLTETGLIARTDTNVPPGIRELAFAIARPGGDRASYASGTLAGGDAAVVLVDEAVDGSFDSLDEQEGTRVKAELLQAKANAYYRALVSDLESRADIERRPVSDSAL